MGYPPTPKQKVSDGLVFCNSKNTYYESGDAPFFELQAPNLAGERSQSPARSRRPSKTPEEKTEFSVTILEDIDPRCGYAERVGSAMLQQFVLVTAPLQGGTTNLTLGFLARTASRTEARP